MIARILAVPVALLSAVAAATPPLPPLAGAIWRVVSIDGRPPAARPNAENRDPPSVTFDRRSYGGGVGCNALGGLYAKVGDRLYTMPGPQTAMGCIGPVGQQEAAFDALFRASPTVRQSGGTVWLEGGGHRMELAYGRPSDRQAPPLAWQGRGLAGQSYVVHEVNGRRTDGKRVWSKTPPRLTFASRTLTMRLDCPRPATARFVEDKDMVEAAGLKPACLSPGTRDGALAAILRGSPAVVSGPNGELLLASRAGWAILWNERRDRPK